ncbi:hypothetical protein FB45DRAFT_190986 [Roridomyces roridus]|uniref:Uncharacterized protein n=1 Tax=Roridomyces roridus TaxID=1738132 RepID=A0AAD7CEY0_9AGAR|nr:hypothetical protein FB45DRAFT_190986 [Roridomyces roridus]
MIPSVQTFCVAHAIPFHIQLCGSVPSLREFYGQEGPRKRQGAVAIIRVFLVRQIYVEITGRETWRSITVGEGHVNPLPPVGLDEPSQGDVAVDWEGTVRCENDITSGTFSIGHLTVKDFIMLAVTPASSSHLLPVQHGQPIRLVTDSWEEQGQVHPRDR